MEVLKVEVIRISIDLFSDSNMFAINCPKTMVEVASLWGVGSFDDLTMIFLHNGFTYCWNDKTHSIEGNLETIHKTFGAVTSG